MKLKALIIDDEPLAHDIILGYAEAVPFLEIVGQCYLATEALSFLKTQTVDLLFLDIRMPKLKGLDLLKILDNKPQVIITSAYEEYALKSFELDVCDYLLKPFRFDRFLKAVNKAHELVQLKQQSTLSNHETTTQDSPPKQLFIKSEKRFIQVAFSDIYFLESFGNYVKVWLAEQFHLTPRTLTSFTTQLDETQFIRIHKSYIVNKNQVAYLEGNMVVMKNKKSLPLGKNYRQAFKGFIS